MTIIKEKLLSKKEKYYSYPVKTIDTEDVALLDQSKTTGLISFGKKEIFYPRFWKGEKFRLPQNEFTLRKYEDVKIKLKSQGLPYNDEGDRVEICADWYPHVNELDKVFPLSNYGANCWQHFVQDNLPILFFSRDFLINNPDVVILTYLENDSRWEQWNKNRTQSSVREYFFDKLGIKNQVVEFPWRYYLDKVEYSAKCNELYNFESNVQLPVFWWNNFFYREISEFLWKDEEPSLKNNVIYVRRNETISRRFSNEGEVVNCLSEYSKNNNLNFVIFEAKDHTLDEISSIFRDAHTVIAPHGGANYNIIFCPKGIKFVEYVFTDCMYSLYNIASSLELDYYMVPNKGTNATESIDVDINKLIKILNS